MVLVTSSKSKQLIQISYIGHVQVGDFQRGREDFAAQLAELSPGLRLLADFSALESMGPDCGPELGRMMDLAGNADVGVIVRVIPDPGKDIGMNILTAFHYTNQPRIVTCENLVQAARALEL